MHPDDAADERVAAERLEEAGMFPEGEAPGLHLVQLLLPIRDDQGRAFPRERYDELVRELTERFGGVTAYTRAPATGLWESESGETVRDQVVVYEVMVEVLEPRWWADLRGRLEAQFAQDEMVVRAHEVRRL